MAKHKRESFSGTRVNARFDNARNTPETAAFFAGSDSLAIQAALSPEVRRTVRDRARYVVFNCPYGFGMLDTYAADVVGPWVTISFPKGKIPEGVRDEVIEAFESWALKVDLWAKIKRHICLME